MKKLICLFVSPVILFSCSSNTENKVTFNEKCEKAIKPFVASVYQIDSSDFKLSIYKIDTLTEKDKYLVWGQLMNDKIDELINEDYKLSKDMYYASKSAYEQFPEDNSFRLNFEESSRQFNEKHAPIQKILDKFELVEKQSLKVDSIKFVAYSVKSIMKYIDSENVSHSDSIQVIMDKDFHVIKKEDFSINP